MIFNSTSFFYAEFEYAKSSIFEKISGRRIPIFKFEHFLCFHSELVKLLFLLKMILYFRNIMNSILFNFQVVKARQDNKINIFDLF